MLLDPGYSLTLRPLRYPQFYDAYKKAIDDNWTIEEITEWPMDLVHLKERLTPAQHHVVKNIVAFFAAGDGLVANNLVSGMYKHLNAPEARLYLSRQLFEETVHIDFYLDLLDHYVKDPIERARVFSATESIHSLKLKAEFCTKWTDTLANLDVVRTIDDVRSIALNIAAFAAGVEGFQFYGSFAYVYFLNHEGLLPALTAGTEWVFRQEVGHMEFAYSVLRVLREEYPKVFNSRMEIDMRDMLNDAFEAESAFASDTLSLGVAGLSRRDMLQYLSYVREQRIVDLGYQSRESIRNPFSFMALQNIQGHTNFFEKTNAEYSNIITGKVEFGESF